MPDNFTITMGLDTGKTVIAYDTQISFNGWKGTGYTILDPVSGAGAYMIGGGLDGGVIEFFGKNQNLITLGLGILSVASIILAAPFVFSVLLIAVSVFSALMITMANNLSLLEAGCPQKLVSLNWLVNIIALSVGSIFGSTVGRAIFLSMSGWIYTSVVSSDSIQSACTNLGN